MDAATITALGSLAAALLTIGGLMVQLARYRSSVRQEVRAELHTEFKPNGGTSIRDAVDRVEHKMNDQGERLAVVETRLCDHLRRSE